MEPFNTLRVKFAEACAKYGKRPFCLLVEEEAGVKEPPHEYYLGYCGLPLKLDDGSIDTDIACRWFAIPWAEDVVGDWGSHQPWEAYEKTSEEIQQSEEARRVFVELATQAAAALPADFRDLITPDILEDVKVHYDPHPPSEIIVWWLVFLWWQFDREFYAHAGRICKQHPWGKDELRFVIWEDPFMASVSAIDRGGLLFDTPPDEIALRDVDEEAAELERQQAEDEGNHGVRTQSRAAEWFNSEPPTESGFRHGPMEGTMQELCAWTDLSRVTLKKYNGTTLFHIQKVAGQWFKLWSNSEVEYGKCCARKEGRVGPEVKQNET